MPTYEDALHVGVVHALLYMNNERRAGFTRCGMYVEFRPTSLLEAAPTCVRCVGHVLPSCKCPTYRANNLLAGKDNLIAGHRATCPVVEGYAAVEGRLGDIARWCVRRGTHNKECDDNGFCQECGYRFDDSNVQLLLEETT